MAKSTTVVETNKLSDAALSSSSDNPAEVEVTEVPFVGVTYPIVTSPLAFGFSASLRSVSSPVPSIEYPPNITDQIHALSVADLIRSGQASSREIPEDAYDDISQSDMNSFDDVQPLSATDWADLAQIYESEIALTETIKREAARRADDSSSDVSSASDSDSAPASSETSVEQVEK